MVAAGRQQEPDIRHREGEKRRLRRRGKVPVETLGEARAHWDSRGMKGLPLLLLLLPLLLLLLRFAS